MTRFRRILRPVALTAVLAVFLITGCSQKHETDVEFVPTPQPVVMEMLKMVGVTKEDIVYDLGCGDGRIVITAARFFGAHGVGVDIDPFLIKQSREKARKGGVTDRVKFIECDLFRVNLSEATVVALYLTPDLNLRLRPKLFQELKPGARVVSNDFNMGGWRPDNMGRLHGVIYEYPDRTYVRDAPFYFWVIPADAAGTWRWPSPTSTGKGEYTLRLAQKFQEITGGINVQGREAPIVDARLVGNQLTFTFRNDRDKAVMWFNGRISGNTIKGIFEVQGGPYAGNYDWNARRSF